MALKTKVLIAALGNLFLVGAMAYSAILTPKAPPTSPKSAERGGIVELSSGQSFSADWPGDSISYTVPAGKSARVEYSVRIIEK